MSKQRVLIIDDSQPIQTLLRARLANEPIDLLVAGSGTDGLAMIHQNPPDLVLLDIEMPQPDGFEVCRRLKSDPTTMNIPVIFLTGSSSTEQKIKGLELGAVDYVTKPFDPAELRARVRAALRLKFLLDLLGRKAQIDGLTGLWNRKYFDTRLIEEESLARRSGHPLSCVLADVDHFKNVNDSHGHPVGDEVLRGVANALNDIIRAEDTVCRYGGEEFVLLLPNTAAAGAAVLAERARAQLEQTLFNRPGGKLTVTASFGVASFNPLAEQGMLVRADNSLYRAKHNGRNRVELDELSEPPSKAAA